jgi:hypothetical protein
MGERELKKKFGTIDEVLDYEEGASGIVKKDEKNCGLLCLPSSS